jgi:hypothetical protein
VSGTARYSTSTSTSGLTSAAWLLLLLLLQSHEYSFYWGSHEQRETTPSKASSSSAGIRQGTAASVPGAASAVSPQQLLTELNAAESPWELLEVAAQQQQQQQQQQHMQLPHQLRLLFR